RFPYLAYTNGGGKTALFCVLLLLSPLLHPGSLKTIFSPEILCCNYLCPTGIGFAMIMISFLVGIYYNIIIAWVVLFLFQSFRADVPWKTCDNQWNTRFCK
ncbi:predicted protein, partial [Nematostella vectensis]